MYRELGETVWGCVTVWLCEGARGARLGEDNDWQLLGVVKIYMTVVVAW